MEINKSHTQAVSEKMDKQIPANTTNSKEMANH